MKITVLFLGALFLLPSLAMAQSEPLKEFDGDYPQHLAPKERVAILWSRYLDQSLDALLFYSEKSALRKAKMGLRHRLKLMEIKSAFESRKKKKFVMKTLSAQHALHLASEEANYRHIDFSFKDQAYRAIKEAKAKISVASAPSNITKDDIEDLVYEGADLASYESGKYHEGIKLFLFCRRDRHYPCRMAMKDRFGSLVRNEDGELWTLPALAKSASNAPFNVTNGHTPQGVHTIDSVMPEANRQRSFGKFRRLILNWVPSDELTKQLLPSSAVNKAWWSQASIARDNGRKWLRVHGTGKINKDPKSLYYPHRPTNGCVSTREGTYPEQTYIDQRALLDKAMESMRMSPVYKNEARIKGVLYVIDLNDKKQKVTLETLRSFGVF